MKLPNTTKLERGPASDAGQWGKGKNITKRHLHTSSKKGDRRYPFIRRSAHTKKKM